MKWNIDRFYFGFILVLVFETIVSKGLQAQDLSQSISPASSASDPGLDTGIPHSLPSGAIFRTPKNWTIAPTKNGSYILQDPDRGVSMLVGQSDDVDGQDAINDLWKTLDPDFSYAVSKVNHFPGRDKWEDVYRVWYWVPDPMDIRKADENRRIYANARKNKNVWYVSLMEFDKAVEDRRNAQVEWIIGGITPPPSPEDLKSSTTAAPMDAAFLKTYADFVEQARDRCMVPGVAIGIVRDGKVVFEKGFGVKELGKKDPVTPQTLFSIGSISKPLTTLLMARLIDAGKLSWDTPLNSLLPDLQLGDPKMTQELDLKHSVCACAGLPRQDADLVFPVGDTTAELTLQKMKTMVPTTGFGETFQYSNIMVAAGGYAAAKFYDPTKSLSDAYESALQAEVFDPLGMKDSTVDFRSLMTKDFASPHCYKLDFDYQTVPLSYDRWINAVAPAAGVWSNVEDMEKYLCLELSKGLASDGTRIVSETNLLKRREPQAKISDKENYGLGLMIMDDKGVTIVEHGGNTTGYTADMFFFPAQNIGVVILTNGIYADIFTDALYHRLKELLFDRPQHAQDDMEKELIARDKDKEILKPWVQSQSAQSWIYGFTGDYYNENLGKITLRMTQAGGELDAGLWKSTVAGFEEKSGEVRFYLTSPPLTWAGFELKELEGRKTMIYDTPQKNYVFELIGTGK